MALNLANVETNDTFQTWYERTNEIIRDAAQADGVLTTAGGTISGTLTVNGDALFNGNTTIISATELTARDAVLHLGANNASDTVDMGMVLQYVRGDGSNTHSGFIRDSVTKEIYILDEAGTGQAGQPFNTFNPNAADTVLANVHVKTLTSTDLSTVAVTSNTVTTHDISATGDVVVDRTVTAASFIGDGSQLTNAGSTVASDTRFNRDLLVSFTGISTGTMTSANVNSTFTYNPGLGVLSANTMKTQALQDSSGRTLTIRNESNTIVWGG